MQGKGEPGAKDGRPQDRLRTTTTGADMGGRKIGMVTLLLLALVPVTAACGADGATDGQGHSGDPHITGAVSSITSTDRPGEGIAGFLVTGTGDYDKAAVRVTAETEWFGDEDGVVRPMKAPSWPGELEGVHVQVRFSGPVAESYPVQATADWVIVEQ
jgi:hypothetical protein